MEFRILGPLEVVDDDGAVLALGSARERALLALLILHGNEVLTGERMVEDLWPSGPPDTATKIVQLYVSHLRKALGAARGLLETRGSGYMLAIPAGATDVGRVERLLREAATVDDPARRAALLRDALAVWRGPPLADLHHEDFAALEAGRLAEWRLAIIENRIAADLEAGQGAELVPELDGLVRAHPLSERLRGQHMLALYRAGRHADALASFRSLRDRLDDELGLEPGSALRQLERRILRHDATLETPVGGIAQGSSAGSRSILVASYDGELDEAIALARVIALAPPEPELLLARLVTPSELAAATRALAERRAELATAGVRARVAAFTSADPAGDLIRLARAEPVDLLVVTVATPVLADAVAAILRDAPCDVALLVAGSTADDGPVMVPFGGARHDWAALGLGARLAHGTGSPLRVIGAASDDPRHRDSSRLLADASLIVQGATGVLAEPVLTAPGASVAEVAREAGTLVVGLAETWPAKGLGPVRSTLATDPPARLVFVHRGARTAGPAPVDELSIYAWSTERPRPDVT